MIATARILIVALLLGLAGVAGSCSEEGAPDDEELRANLAELRKQIDEAKEAAEQHKSGLVGEMAAMRREILLLSAAMLENRLIANDGGVPAKLVAPALSPNPVRAEQILRHIAAAEEELEDAKEDAAGQEGVAANLSQTAVMTHELTLAQLRLAYYQAAYGIALPGQQRPALARSSVTTAQAGIPAGATAETGSAAASDEPGSREPIPALSPAEIDALIEQAESDGSGRQAAAASGAPEVTQAPAPRTLGPDDYERIQLLLRDAGHDPGPIDGQPGPRTRAALTAFQRSEGLPSSGKPDAATLDALGLN